MIEKRFDKVDQHIRPSLPIPILEALENHRRGLEVLFEMIEQSGMPEADLKDHADRIVSLYRIELEQTLVLLHGPDKKNVTDGIQDE